MNDCQIAKDLIPLYVEDLISEESRDFVEEHIKTCHDCQQFYEQIKEEYQKTTQAAPKDQQVDQLITRFLKYQSWLKLSFAFVLTMAAVVFSVIPVPFLSTFSLLVIAPVLSVFLYKRIWPLLLVNVISVMIGMSLPSETISEGVFFGILYTILLSLSTIAGHFFWKYIGQWKINSKSKRAYSIGVPALVIAGLLFVNSGFTGNPVGYVSSYFTITSYLKEQYPDEDLKIEGIYFSWYDSHYYAKVASGSEKFIIDRYRTGYIADQRSYAYTANYGEHFEELLELALNQAARDKGNDSQFFWVTNVMHAETIMPLDEVEFIIRFAESNEQYPTMSTLTEEQFLQLCQLTIDTFEKLNIPYKTINFQALDEDGEEMHLDLENGLTEQSIYRY